MEAKIQLRPLLRLQEAIMGPSCPEFCHSCTLPVTTPGPWYQGRHLLPWAWWPPPLGAHVGVRHGVPAKGWGLREGFRTSYPLEAVIPCFGVLEANPPHRWMIPSSAGHREFRVSATLQDWSFNELSVQAVLAVMSIGNSISLLAFGWLAEARARKKGSG